MKTMKIGLERGMVKLESHCQEWKESFQDQKKVLANRFSGNFLYIEHIGSTAISTIKAKPIIDILMVLPDHYNLDNAVGILEEIGFIKGEFQRDEGLFFMKGTNTFHTHYLHLVNERHNWKIYLKFRDYLNQNLSEALKYEALKLKLERKFQSKREGYTSSKDSFISEVLAKIS